MEGSLLPTRLQFAVFEVDLEIREVRKRGSRVRLPHQAFQVLQLLLERRGHVVTRDELHRALWPADTFVEFDRGVNNAISRLRDLLDDSSKDPRFIETIPRVGYRFIAPVTAAPRGDARRADEKQAEEKSVAPDRTTPPRRWLMPAFAVTLLVFVGILTWQYVGRGRESMPKSLAVLPLNYQGPPGGDYLAEGMTDALTTELSKLDSVRVISETSSRRFARTTKSLPEIARELNVEAVVEGSVLRDGDAVRVTVQLIRADDRHVWAETYTRALRSMLALHSEVALAIAQAIGEQFSPEERGRMTRVRGIDPEAYRLYVAGAALRRRHLEAEFYSAIDQFQQALAIEPDYARAYVGIAESWIALGSWTGAVLPREGFPKAKAAAERAVRIDPNLAEAQLALAYVTELYDWDLKSAEQLYLRALAIDPNNALAYQRYAQHLNRTGRLREGVVKAQRGYELDPLSEENLIELGGRLVDSGKVAEGLAIMRRAIDLDPTSFEPWSHIAENYSRARRLDDAIAAGKRGVELSNQSTHAMQMLATIYATNGRRTDARALLKTLEAGPRRNPHTVAMLHLRLGDYEEALRWLETACNERTPQIAFMRFQERGPQFNPIRNNPRFDGIVKCSQRILGQ